MQVDPLNDVLNLVEARSVVSTGLRATGAWSIRVGDYRGMKFNAVLEGNCVLKVMGHSAVELSVGDCFLLTKGSSFVIGSDLDTPAEPANVIFKNSIGHYATMDRGNSPTFRSIGGRMDMISGIDFLVEALPALIVLKAASAEATRVHLLLNYLELEIARKLPGADVATSAVMQLIFIEMIRASRHSVDPSWLGAALDPRIGKALTLIHTYPARAWQLKELASATGLSRSQFSARFVQLVGISPIDYLKRWRMNLAKKALRTSDSKVASIARDLGYKSEAAFGVAFKRVHGVSPRSTRP